MRRTWPVLSSVTSIKCFIGSLFQNPREGNLNLPKILAQNCHNSSRLSLHELSSHGIPAKQHWLLSGHSITRWNATKGHSNFKIAARERERRGKMFEECHRCTSDKLWIWKRKKGKKERERETEKGGKTLCSVKHVYELSDMHHKLWIGEGKVGKFGLIQIHDKQFVGGCQFHFLFGEFPIEIAGILASGLK